jgi:hypothetical protein
MTTSSNPDVILIGAGIMSATLAVILKELDPALKIEIHEVLGSEAQESSNAWNNAGTGHAALCELNYTPQRADGSIDISKALQVNTEYDLSRQLWAYLVKKGAIEDPQAFIHAVPHFSFVQGTENRNFLRERFKALSRNPLYSGMEYSEDPGQISRWKLRFIDDGLEGLDPYHPVQPAVVLTQPCGPRSWRRLVASPRTFHSLELQRAGRGNRSKRSCASKLSHSSSNRAQHTHAHWPAPYPPARFSFRARTTCTTASSYGNKRLD